MNQDQKAALAITASEVWEELKFPATVIAGILYVLLFIIFTQFMFVVTCGALGSMTFLGIRRMYLNNLSYVQFKREVSERKQLEAMLKEEANATNSRT